MGGQKHEYSIDATILSARRIFRRIKSNCKRGMNRLSFWAGCRPEFSLCVCRWTYHTASSIPNFQSVFCPKAYRSSNNCSNSPLFLALSSTARRYSSKAANASSTESCTSCCISRFNTKLVKNRSETYRCAGYQEFRVRHIELSSKSSVQCRCNPYLVVNVDGVNDLMRWNGEIGRPKVLLKTVSNEYASAFDQGS
jgi:hypothetical protein